MKKITSEEKIISEYEKATDIIIKDMFRVLMRAQRKTESESYRKILATIQNI